MPDGYYNIGFRLYTQETGGSPAWTEIYHDANGSSPGEDRRVKVVNGYFNVKLGSLQAFTGINWGNDLWMTMNIGGTAQVADSAQIAWDGEMSPRIQLTSVPNAMNANTVGGKTADTFVQIGQGTQTDASGNTSIAINKTGTGNLVRLQSSGSDIFTINGTGGITMGSVSTQSISVATSTTGAGQSLVLAAGSAASSSNAAGGSLVLQGGAGDGTGAGGSVIAKARDNSAAAFQVQNTAGGTVLAVDTAEQKLTLGTLSLASPTTNTGLGHEVTLWSDTIPSGVSENEGSPLNLGMVFKSSLPGSISGVRFYQPEGANVAGTNVGKLWACNTANCDLGGGGTELAAVTFPSDQTEGWKTATFSSPIQIPPDTYYVISYYSVGGRYFGTNQFFSSNYTHGSLFAPNDAIIRNGRYTVGSAAFPNNSYSQSNYWVDVVFQPSVKVDSLHSTGNLLLGSSGSMTIGPSADSLTLQGSSMDLASNDIAIGTTAGSTTIKSELSTQDLSVKASTDSTGTFSVQNAANITQLSVDTANNRVAIGTADTSGTLLVLDTKTGAGDPTGTNGAMYYNSAAAKFRCFENNVWVDCVTPLPVSKVASTDTIVSNTTPVDASGLEFTLAANTKYYYKFIIIHEAAAQTTGIGFGVTTPSSPAMSNWCVNTTSTLTSATPGHWGSYCGVSDASATTTGAENLGTKYSSTMEGYIQTSSAGGPLKLRLKSETNASVTLKSGSFGILQIVQ